MDNIVSNTIHLPFLEIFKYTLCITCVTIYNTRPSLMHIYTLTNISNATKINLLIFLYTQLKIARNDVNNFPFAFVTAKQSRCSSISCCADQMLENCFSKKSTKVSGTEHIIDARHFDRHFVVVYIPFAIQYVAAHGRTHININAFNLQIIDDFPCSGSKYTTIIFLSHVHGKRILFFQTFWVSNMATQIKLRMSRELQTYKISPTAHVSMFLYTHSIRFCLYVIAAALAVTEVR